MPPVIVAVVAAVGASLAAAGAGAVVFGSAAAFGAALAAGSLTALAISAGVTAVVGALISYAGNALIAGTSGKPKGRTDTASAAADARRTVRLEAAPRRIVYGRSRVSGPLIYAASFGERLESLILVVPLADHVIEGIDAYWLGEYRIDPSELDGGGLAIAGRYNNFVALRAHLGNQTTADPLLVGRSPDGWSTNDKLTGVAYVFATITYNPDLFQSGVPSISAEVRGRKVYDPRTGGRAYSDNWALVILDYLTSEHGLAASMDEIDLESFIVAANLSDEDVQFRPTGETQKRYTLNGSFTLDRQPADVLEEMLAAGAGALVYTAGKYRLYGGAYEAPAVTVTASDLASDVEVVTKPPRREIFNAVRGNYINPAVFWQASAFAPVEWRPFIEQDGETIWRELELPWVLDPFRARRLAKQLLMRSRQGVTIRAAFKFARFDLSVWQTVAVTIESLGFVEKPFRITSWSFTTETGLLTLTMQEEQVASYAWAWDEERAEPEVPDTTLVNPFQTPAPAGLQVTEALYLARDGAGVHTKAVLSWVDPQTPFAIGYDVQWKPAAEDRWRAAPAVAESPGEVLALGSGTYDFRVRATTAVGKGAWATVRASIGALAAQPPAAVSGLGLATIGGVALMRWERSPDLDVRVGGRFEIRHTPVPITGSPTWASATSIGDAVAGEQTTATLPLKPGTYLIRAVDSSGIYGPVAIIGANQGRALAFANVTSVPQHPGFSGARSGTVVASSTLRLDTTGLVDAEASFDAIADLDRLGGVRPSGSYTFAAGIDLGSVRGIRLTSHLVAQVENAAGQWDSRTGLFDGWGATDDVFGGEADAWVETRTTNDNPVGSPTWSDWQRLDAAEFRARAFEFRAQLRSTDAAFNIHASELSVSADEVV